MSLFSLKKVGVSPPLRTFGDNGSKMWVCPDTPDTLGVLGPAMPVDLVARGDLTGEGGPPSIRR